MVLGNFILIMAAFLIDDIAVLESASASKRVIYQTFFDNNLFLTCYGTCSHSLNGFSSSMKNFRCEGTNVRLKCNRGYVIRVSFAFYGELEAGQEVCRDVSSLFEQCRKDVSEIVKKDCNGKGLCLLAVDDKRFGKFCQGQYFYLDIRHSCEAKPSTSGNTEHSTVSNGYTTKELQTTQKATKIKPITIYTDGKSSPSGTSTGNRDETTHGSTNSKEPTDSKSSSHSLTSTANTHRPIPGAGGGVSTKDTTGQNSITVSKVATLLPTRLSRSSGKKASLYWLLTAHSLVTDKGFIKANSTHLVLAIILSIFIALVICICFLLDHSRRQTRKRSRKQTREECSSGEGVAPLENGSPVGYDLLQEQSSRPKSSINPLISNGNAKRLSTRSLDEFNHNTKDGSEFLPLLPIVAQSLNGITREGNKVSSQVLHSSLIDHLPPPPEELLLDSPRQDVTGFLDDNESEASTVSIPPPIGFTDSDVVDKSTPSIKSELHMKSPPLAISSLTFNHKPLANTGKSLGQKIDNAQRLNNEFCSEISAASHDNNLLHNSVSVQTNDLRENHDKRSRSDNAGHVSMKSPFLDVSDTYAKADDISSVTAMDLQEFRMKELHDLRGSSLRDTVAEEKTMDTKNGILTALACDDDDTFQNAKRGKLIVIKSSKEKSDTSESKCGLIGNSDMIEKDLLLSQIPPIISESGGNSYENSRIKGVIANGSIGTSWSSSILLDDPPMKIDEKDDNMASVSSVDSDTSVLPRYDAVSKQIFAVPKHRCGMGHTHKCVCIPLRTGSSSFICSCLENAKYKFLKCCVENCSELKSTGMPYSSRRSSNWRGLATDIPRRKNYNSGNIKRASSLEEIDHKPGKYADIKKDEKDIVSSDKREKKDRLNECRSNTLPHLQSKLKKANITSSGSKTLDRVHWASDPRTRHDSKLIPVIVHTNRNKQVSRFEKSTEKNEDNMRSIIHGDAFRSNRSEDSDSSDRSGSTEGRSVSLPTTPVEKRRKKNGHHRLSPISENASKKPSSQDQKPWPKISPRFRIQVVESMHYDKKKQVNEV